MYKYFTFSNVAFRNSQLNDHICACRNHQERLIPALQTIIIINIIIIIIIIIAFVVVAVVVVLVLVIVVNTSYCGM